MVFCHHFIKRKQRTINLIKLLRLTVHNANEMNKCGVFFRLEILIQRNDGINDPFKNDPVRENCVCLPRIGNGFVWTVSVVDGTILCEAVGDIALALELVPFPMLYI